MPSSSGNTDITATAGEALSAGDCAYLSDGSGALTAGRWYQCDADNTYEASTAGIVGLATAAIASAGTGTVRISGRMTGLSGLTTGEFYYASATAGALTATPPTNQRFIGQADSTTTLDIGGGSIGGVVLPDSDGTHRFTLITTSNATADRRITILPGDSDRELTFSGNLNVSGSSTINQDVSTSGAPTFATVNTGQGANELYPMNQDVTTTGTPTFGNTTFSGTTTLNALAYTWPSTQTANATLHTDGSGTLTWSTSTAPRSIISTTFEATGRFTETVVSGGTVTYDTSGATITSSGTISSSAVVRWEVVRAGTGGTFTTVPAEFSCSLDIDGVGTDIQAFVGLGNITIGGAGITYTSDHIGFKMVRAASGSYELFATQAGGTETASAALTTIANDDFLDLSFRINSATSVSYYWRLNGSAWSAATELTTNIPTTAGDDYASFGVSNAGVATEGKFHVHGASYTR